MLGATVLIFEAEDGLPCPIDFGGDTAPLVYFISFAVAERYGAQHDLARLAALLKRQNGLSLSPLARFGLALPETAADIDELETLWQEATALAACARDAAKVIRTTTDAHHFLEAYPDLPDRLDDLAGMADWAAARNARVRLTYLL